MRYLDGGALGPTVCAVGLLSASGPYHRIVMGGEDDACFHRLVTFIADLALLPFALALGLDVLITAGRIFGDAAGAMAGSAAAGVAIGSWTFSRRPPVWICGKCHLGNLGPLADTDGQIAILLRDLDYSVISNPAHDLIRLGCRL